jgi:hypothetical protein
VSRPSPWTRHSAVLSAEFLAATGGDISVFDSAFGETAGSRHVTVTVTVTD